MPTDRLNRTQNGTWADRPLAVVQEISGRAVLMAVNGCAEQGGATPGMSLADARALCPVLSALPVDPAADQALLERLADWCLRYTPWVALDGADGLLLDVSGCAHLMGGEVVLLDDLRLRLEDAGLTVRTALAATPAAARALARCGRNGAIVPADGTKAALSGLPVEGLAPPPDTLANLHRLGLRSIGDVLPLPRAALAARFGLDLALRLDHALGFSAEPINFRPFRPVYEERLVFAEPIGLRDDIERSLNILLQSMVKRLEPDGKGCRKLTLSFERVDGTVQAISAGTAAPVRDADHLARLFAEKLDTVEPGFGIDRAVLTAPVVEPLAPGQETIIPAAAPGELGQTAGLAPLIDRLGSRLGLEHVIRLAPVDSHLPDRAVRRAPALDPVPDRWPRQPMRPTRLLRRPEPIDVVAPLADGDPGEPPGLFQWRGRRHRVQAAQGPERFAPEWWRQAGAWRRGTRDYYRIQDERGARFWVFRTGMSRRRAFGAPDWFMHGFFS